MNDLPPFNPTGGPYIQADERYQESCRRWQSRLWGTLYTDASYHPEQGASWAVWARCEEGRIVESGACPGEIDDNNVAELYAIAMGVKIIREEWPHLGGIGVRSDSKSALAVARYGAAVPNHPHMKRLQVALKEVLGDCWIKCTWVRGHAKGDHSAAWLNHQVDALAKGAR